MGMTTTRDDFKEFCNFRDEHPNLNGAIEVQLTSGSRLLWNFTTNEPIMYSPYIPYIFTSEIPATESSPEV